MLPQKGGTLKPPPPPLLPVSQMKSQRKMINWGGFCSRQLPVSWEPRSPIEVRRVICTNISLLHEAALKNELITCEPKTPTSRTVGQKGRYWPGRNSNWPIESIWADTRMTRQRITAAKGYERLTFSEAQQRMPIMCMICGFLCLAALPPCCGALSASRQSRQSREVGAGRTHTPFANAGGGGGGRGVGVEVWILTVRNDSQRSPLDSGLFCPIVNKETFELCSKDSRAEMWRILWKNYAQH